MFMNVPGTEGSEGLPPRTVLTVLNLAILLGVKACGIAVLVSGTLTVTPDRRGLSERRACLLGVAVALGVNRLRIVVVAVDGSGSPSPVHSDWRCVRAFRGVEECVRAHRFVLLGCHVSFSRLEDRR